jgi:L-ascorbate metabolism protein UlaG (beta-lactamase superfamily)
MRTRQWGAVLGFLVAAAAVVWTPQASADEKVEVLWLGQSAFRVTTPGGHVIVIDPYLIDNPKTPERYKHLEALGKVDLILVTHAHLDHFADAPALARLNHAPVYGPAGLDQSMQTLGILPPELAPRMNKGGTITPFPGVHITQVHAEHSSELLWTNPATGKQETHVGGEPVGFIIELENGFRIYHMGDTGLFGDMRLIGERYHPDLLMIPIGGHFVMDPVDAAYATRELVRPKGVIPMHYGTTALLKGTPEEFEHALGATDIRVYKMQPGDILQY